MICKGCGKNIPDNYLFCDVCGTKNEGAASTSESSAVVETAPVSEQPEEMVSDSVATAAEETVPETVKEDVTVKADEAFTGSQQNSVENNYYVQQGGSVAEGPVSMMTQPETKKKSGALTIVFAILAGVFLAAAAVFAVFFFKGKNELKEAEATVEELTAMTEGLQTNLDAMQSQIEDLGNEVNNMADENQILRDNYDYLEECYNNILDENNELYSQKEELDKLVTDYESSSSTAVDIYDLMTVKSMYAPSYFGDFYVSSDVLVMTPGETQEIDITLDHLGSTVYWDTSDTSVISTSYDPFEDNTFTMYVTAENTGISLITFTNSVNDETFDVVVFVKGDSFWN